MKTVNRKGLKKSMFPFVTLAKMKGHDITYNVCSATQSCPTLFDPVDCCLPGSSVHGIFQAVILEWVAISCSRVSSPPMDWVRTSCVFCFACGFFALFITASLGVGLFGLIVFETPCASCVWISVSFFRFGKFSAIIHSHTFQSPFLLLLESLLCVDWHTLCYHTLLSFFFHLTFNLFFFWLDNFHYSV